MYVKMPIGINNIYKLTYYTVFARIKSNTETQNGPVLSSTKAETEYK